MISPAATVVTVRPVTAARSRASPIRGSATAPATSPATPTTTSLIRLMFIALPPLPCGLLLAPVADLLPNPGHVDRPVGRHVHVGELGQLALLGALPLAGHPAEQRLDPAVLVEEDAHGVPLFSGHPGDPY